MKSGPTSGVGKLADHQLEAGPSEVTRLDLGGWPGVADLKKGLLCHCLYL
jgi:hypothetical protein